MIIYQNKEECWHPKLRMWMVAAKNYQRSPVSCRGRGKNDMNWNELQLHWNEGSMKKFPIV